MPKGTIFLNMFSSQTGTMSFELASIYASGGPDFPVLTIRTDISLSPYIEHNQRQPIVHPLTLLRALGRFCSPEHRVVARFQEDIALCADNPTHARTTQVLFEVPLDLITIARIEAERSGDLRVQLNLQLLFAMHNADAGLDGFHIGRVDGLIFTIPRSQWVDTLLPALGYHGLELLEVRYGTGVVAGQLPKSVQEIREAQKSLLEGQWEKAVMHCRKAIELILDSRPSSLPATAKFRDRVNAFIGDNLKTLTDAESKLLAGQMGLIWEVSSSQAAHAAPANPITRADAEFLTRCTMALVEYFSRLLN